MLIKISSPLEKVVDFNIIATLCCMRRLDSACGREGGREREDRREEVKQNTLLPWIPL